MVVAQERDDATEFLSHDLLTEPPKSGQLLGKPCPRVAPWRGELAAAKATPRP